jgi:hypothetical protein
VMYQVDEVAVKAKKFGRSEESKKKKQQKE